MHNFDLILNYFCFARATETRNTAFHLEYKQQKYTIYKVSFAEALSKGKIQRKCQNLGDIIHWRPPLQILGAVSPRPPRFTPLRVSSTQHDVDARAI